MKTEKTSEYYDNIYSEGYSVGQYERIYLAIERMLCQEDKPRVLEIGCGFGNLGQKIIQQGIFYRGFDFSSEAIRLAKGRCSDKVWQGNAYDKKNYEGDYNTVIAVEVFEHLDDKKVLAMIRPGTRIIVTVPDYDDPSHLRKYRDIEFIKNYYDGIIHINKFGSFHNADIGTMWIFEGVKLPENPLTWENKPTISACLIVRDEQDFMAGCLYSIREIADEIIICDTGSNDRTLDIVHKLDLNEKYSGQIRIFQDPWEKDFSYHRNLSIGRATKDWILIIDADERIMSEDLKTLVRDLSVTTCDMLSLRVFNDTEVAQESVYLPSVRLFKRKLNLRYQSIIHNTLKLPVGKTVYESTARIRHLGYDVSPEKQKQKFARTRELLEKVLEQDPSPNCYFNLGNSLLQEKDLYDKADLERAAECFRIVIRDTDAKGQKRHLYLMSWVQKAWCHLHMEQMDRAEISCRAAIRYKPDYLDALIVLGHSLFHQARYQEALGYYEQYISYQKSYDPAKDKFLVAMNNMNAQDICQQKIKECRYEMTRTKEPEKKQAVS